MIGYVYVPHFALRVAVLDRPELDGVPLALSAPPGTRPAITDRTPEAAANGVQPGMTVREATALCPDPCRASAPIAASSRATTNTRFSRAVMDSIVIPLVDSW